MKTLNLFMHFILISLLVVSVSCKKDKGGKAQPEPEDTTPILKVIGDVKDFIGVSGSTDNGEVNFMIEASTPAGFKSLNIYKVVDGKQTLVKSFSIAEVTLQYDKVYTAEISYLIEEEDVEREVYFEGYVLDSANIQSTTIKLANLQAFGKISYFGEYVGTTLPAANGGVSTPNFLVLGTGTIDLSMAEMVTNNLSSEVDLVFSVNDGLGYYLTSPAACIEDELLVKFQQLNTTKLKVVDVAPEAFNDLNPFKTLEVMDIYEQGEFYSHEERAGQMEEGKCIAFKTDDGQTGLMMVKQFYTDNEAEPAVTYIKLGIWIYL